MNASTLPSDNLHVVYSICCNLNLTFDDGVRNGEVRLYFLCFKIIIDYYFKSPDEQTIFI